MKGKKELKAGIIAVIAIISFILLYQFMKGKNFFSTDDVYYSLFENVQGLQVSDPVSINGLKVGQVEEIKPMFGKNGNISFTVKISIDDDFKFSKNSSLEIFEPGFMSGKEMKINLADNGPEAKSGDTLKGAFEVSLMSNLSSQVEPVKNQVQTVLKSIDSLSANANRLLDAQNQQEIKMLLASLNRTVKSFEATSQQTNRLLANNDPRVQRVLDNTNLAAISARNAIDQYGRVAQDIDTKKLNASIEQLDQTARKLNTVISGIENGNGTLGKLTQDNELYNNLNQTSKDLNELILDIKTNPKRYLNISVFGKSPK